MNGYKVRSIDSQEYKISTYAEVLRRRFSTQTMSNPKIGSQAQPKQPSCGVGARPKDTTGDERNKVQRDTNEEKMGNLQTYLRRLQKYHR